MLCCVASPPSWRRSRCVGTVAAPHERCWTPQKQILDLKVNQHLSALQLVELMAHILYCRFSERLVSGVPAVGICWTSLLEPRTLQM